MLWNWQQPDWPEFEWDARRLEHAEREFLVGGGMLLGIVTHLGDDGRDHIAIEAMSTEAVTTAEIEGEILDRASVQSSIQRQLGLAVDERRIGPRERSIAEMIVKNRHHVYHPESALLDHPESAYVYHRESA